MRGNFQGQRIVILGAARSGIAAALLLRPLAAQVVIADDAPREMIEKPVREALGDIAL